MLLLGLAAALTLGPVSAPAPHGTEAIELRWTAPAGCPTAETAEDLVARLVPATEARLRADATIEAVPGGFAGTLELQAPPSGIVRRLRADDCMVLARAMAVVIAVSLDPVAVAESERASAIPEPEPVEGSVEPARAQPSPADDAMSETERAQPSTAEAMPRDEREPMRSRDSVVDPRGEPRRRPGRLEGGARIGAGVGGLLLPAPGVGLVLAPFIGTARVHVRAVVQYWAPQEVALAPPRDARGELQLVTGGLRACPMLAWGRVRLPLCAGIDAGAMIGEGKGRDLPSKQSAVGPWVGAVLEPGVTVGVTSRVSLWLALEGVVSLYRPIFAIEGAPEGEAWTAGAGAVRGLFGVEVHAPRKRSQNP